LGSSFLVSSFFGSSIFFGSGFLGVPKTESEDSPNSPVGSATTVFFFCSFGGSFLGGGTSPKRVSASPLNRARGSLFFVGVGAKLKIASFFGVCVAIIFSGSFLEVPFSEGNRMSSSSLENKLAKLLDFVDSFTFDSCFAGVSFVWSTLSDFFLNSCVISGANIFLPSLAIRFFIFSVAVSSGSANSFFGSSDSFVGSFVTCVVLEKENRVSSSSSANIDPFFSGLSFFSEGVKSPESSSYSPKILAFLESLLSPVGKTGCPKVLAILFFFSSIDSAGVSFSDSNIPDPEVLIFSDPNIPDSSDSSLKIFETGSFCGCFIALSSFFSSLTGPPNIPPLESSSNIDPLVPNISVLLPTTDFTKLSVSNIFPSSS